MVKVYVVYGKNPDKDRPPGEYEFSTAGELKAFKIGLREGQGWDDATTFETEKHARDYISLE